MSTRVLLVDDDPTIIATYQRYLRGVVETDIASNGQEALAALERGTTYAVIVADMQMPRISGLEVLVAAQKKSPDTVRIMITSAEDQRTAMDAVNAGRVFRFLAKPIRPEFLVGAVRAAIEQFNFVRRERELLEETFNGIVNMLTGVLSAVQPETFGQFQQLRERAARLGLAIGVPSTWEIETAAMLHRVGITTVPRPVLAKMRTNEPLSELEADIVNRIPDIGARLLENIPRLRPVAEIVRCQGKGFDGSGQPQDDLSGEKIPIGARVLRPLLDLQAHEQSGLTTAAAILLMRQDQRPYDPEVLKRLDIFVETEETKAAEVQERFVEDLIPGLVLATDVLSDERVPLITEGTQLTPVLIERLRNFADLGRVLQPVHVRTPKPENNPSDPAGAAHLSRGTVTAAA